MEKQEINHINRHINGLVDNTNCNTTCITFLTQNGVLGKDDVAILDSIFNQREKVRIFYNIIMTKADSYKHLIKALDISNQSGAVKVLQKLKEENCSTHDYQQLRDEPVPGTSRNRNNTPVRFDVLEPVRLFTGRLDELGKLHQALQKSDSNIAVISQMLTIAGLGGIGKTELARCYIKTYSEDYDNNLIWINAETQETLTESFRRLATDHLKLSTLNVDGKEKKITSVIDEVYNFFKEERVLFVFDNAESKEYIQMFMPIRVSHIPYLLITSRDKEWSFSAEVLELHELTEQEAIRFVKKGLQIQNNTQDESIVQLVNRLQYFPLALSQVISYVKQKQKLFKFTIEDYLTLFESYSEKLLNASRPAAELNSYTKTTQTTWKVTTDLILANKDVGSRAMLMLNMISFFQPDKIPIKFLVSDITYTDETAEDQYEDALYLLVKHSMVNIQPNEKTISVHRLVQEVTRTRLRQTQMMEKTLRSVMDRFSENIDPEYLSHIYAVFKHCGAYKSLVIDFKAVTWQILDTFFPHKRSQYVLDIGTKLGNVLRVHTCPDDVDLLRLERRLADLEYYFGGSERSLQIFDKIWNFYEENKTKELEEDEIIITQQLFARVLNRVGKQTESLKLLLQSYQKLISLKGEYDSQTIQTLADIANCLRELGHFKEPPPTDTGYFQLLTDEFRPTNAKQIISIFKRMHESK